MNALELVRQVRKIGQRSCLASNVEIRFLVHPAFQLDNTEKNKKKNSEKNKKNSEKIEILEKEENSNEKEEIKESHNSISKYIGLGLEGSIFSFTFSLKNENLISKNLNCFPFQVQLYYNHHSDNSKRMRVFSSMKNFSKKRSDCENSCCKFIFFFFIFFFYFFFFFIFFVTLFIIFYSITFHFLFIILLHLFFYL